MCETPYNALTPRGMMKVRMQVSLQEAMSNHPSIRTKRGLSSDASNRSGCPRAP
jgi:hypothetical protein